MTDMDRRAPQQPSPPRPSQLRPGPIPLPLHLTLAALAQLSSRTALPLLSSGSLPWSPDLTERAGQLVRELASVEPERFAAAVDAASRQRFAEFLTGLERYRRHPYRRRLADPPVIWREGGSRLLDYGAADARGPVLFVVPSLINRAYVLDLTERRSLLRHLAGLGFRPYLVDWGTPGADERGFGLSEYIAGRLDRAFTAARLVAGDAPLGVIGYCMGGLLALALAERRPAEIDRLALLATPWDFHADRPDLARTTARVAAPFLPLWQGLGVMPVEALQAMFTGLDPCLALNKFAAFGRLDPGADQAEAFVALEDWLNDGVPLAVTVARECLLGWYGENTPGTGRWQVAGAAVRPETLDVPTLVVLPKNDRIVPPASAEALARIIPGAETMTPPAGHIGMVVGGTAPAAVWAPLAAWLGGPRI
jgi:poly[(R)-3-hydroxyalkanoate] polymerase subunit PhaC